MDTSENPENIKMRGLRVSNNEIEKLLVQNEAE